MTGSVLLDSGSWISRDVLQKGHILASPDGHCNEVLAVGSPETVAAKSVAFRDHRQVTVGIDQRWVIHSDRWTAGQKNLDTSQLFAASKIGRNEGRLGTPLVDGNFGSGDLPLSPWLLGVLLGDGCFRGTSLTFTTADDEIRLKVSRHAEKYGAILAKRSELTWGIRAGYQENRVAGALVDLGIWGLTSLQKHIPAQYLSAGLADRVAILQGLMDTDGTAGKDGSVQYCSSSEVMARQVQSLVHSIGGVCSQRRKPTTHADTHILGIRLRDPAEAFSLERKRARLAQPNRNAPRLAPKIVSVADAPPIQTRPFLCSHPEGLFVGQSYIVMQDDRGGTAWNG